MARNDDHTEERLNENRSRRRQNREVPFVVRSDGVLMPNVPLIAKKQNFRPYHGPTKPAPSRQQLIDYYNGYGQSQRRKVVFTQPQEPFDLGTAGAAEIVDFALTEFGVELDAAKPLAELRQDCYRLATLPDIPVPVAPPPDPYRAADMDVPGVSDITAPPKPQGDGHSAGTRRRRSAPVEG